MDVSMGREERKDNVREDCERAGLTLTQAVREAHDRVKWRSIWKRSMRASASPGHLFSMSKKKKKSGREGSFRWVMSKTKKTTDRCRGVYVEHHGDGQEKTILNSHYTHIS